MPPNKRIQSLLKSLEQTQLLEHLDSLSKTDLYHHLVWLSKVPKNIRSHPKKLLPLKKAAYFDENGYKALGYKLVEQGLVSCLILAGGEGSRLGFKKPKGCFPFTAFNNKTLFEFLFEKIKAKQKISQKTLYFTIMTSSRTHHETVEFLQKKKYFGLKKNQIQIVEQSSFPILSYPQKKLILHQNTLASAPNGNGGLVEILKHSEFLKWLRTLKIQYLDILAIDNPLAEPFDPYLIGFQKAKSHDIVIQCFERSNGKESLGLLFKNGKKIEIHDYFKLPESLYLKKGGKDNFYCNYANTGHYAFNLSFLKQMKNKTLPIHRIQKDTIQFGEKRKIIKAETFLFDLFKYARSCGALCYPRDLCYAPLKQKTGINGIASVVKALKKNSL